MKKIVKEISLSPNTLITIEGGMLAQLADGSVVVRMGDAMLLATVVANREEKQGINFLPLSVDYQEKFAANGKIPGGFLKREGRLSEHEILISRLIDRALRPLFPKEFRCETQVMVTLISADINVAPDALACLAASSSIMLSDIPFEGPVAEVRVARVKNELLINPSPTQIAEADIDLIVAGTEENIVMVEGEMNEISENEMVEAIRFAHGAITELCKAQKEFVQAVGYKEKRELPPQAQDTILKGMIYDWGLHKLLEISTTYSTKKERKVAYEKAKASFIEQLPDDIREEKEALANQYFDDLHTLITRQGVVNENSRLDGRKQDEIRPIWSLINYLPSAHGSALFTRGETQSLTTVTLGGKRDEQMVDSAMNEGYNKFMLHYNFPPFCTGEAKPNRGSSRREIGHGNLAMRTIKKILPSEEECPYTIRVVSDILQSNGSSSMATVCAASLALMDAGVPVKKAVAGIAMGLIVEGDRYAILSDILGDEDHIGDMDFKVTGTEKGICACQMDIKVKGLSFHILLMALEQARKGILHILGEMGKTIKTPNNHYKPTVPKVVRFTIPKEFIGAVIGGGGKNIQELQKRTSTVISIEEQGEWGMIEIASVNREDILKAQAYIKSLAQTPEAGKVYRGTVTDILEFGAMVEIFPGKKGLLHISEIDIARVDDVSNFLTQGQELEVKLLQLDSRTGKMRLSRKALLMNNQNAKEYDHHTEPAGN